MKLFKIALLALAMSVGMGAIIESAEAARLGGGRNMGATRSITQRQATPPQQATQANNAQPQAAAQQPNRWMGPLMGLAAGLGLGWLFSQGGMGALLPLLLLGAGIAFIMFMMKRQREAAGMQAGQAGRSPLQYDGAGNAGNDRGAVPLPSQVPPTAWGGGATAQAPAIPAGFDTAGFLKQAKVNFIRLQEANDRADLDTLRDVTSEKLYEQLAADIRHRTGAQQTEVANLDASVLEVVTEEDMHWASVRFSGQVRETVGGLPTAFAEVWHLSKPVAGDSGWLVAGIEQIS